MTAVLGKLIRPIRTINVLGAIPPAPDAVDYAIELDKAKSQYLLIGNPVEVQITGDLTIQFDMKITSQPGNGASSYQLFAKVDAPWLTDGSYWVQLYYDGAYKFRFNVDTGTGDASNRIGGVYNWVGFALNTRYRMRVSVDVSARTSKLFIDGSEKSWTTNETQGSGTSINNGAGDLEIGAGAVSRFSDVILDNVLIANTYTASFSEATTGQVGTDYLSNMAGLWLMNEIDGSGNIPDEINGNDADLKPDGDQPVLVEGISG